MADERGLDRRSFLAVCGAAALAGCGAAPRASDGTSTTPPETTATATETATTTPTETQSSAGADPSLGDLSWQMRGGDAHNTGVIPTTGPQEAPQRAWEVPVEGIYTLPQPSLVDGVCYVGTGRKLYAMGVPDGERRWTTSLDYLGHHYSPAVIDGTVYAPSRTMEGVRAGGGEGRLYAVDAATGDVAWQVDGPLSSDPTVVGDTVYFTTSGTAGRVHAVSTDGGERWSYGFEREGQRTSAYGAPVVVDDTVYVTVSAHEETGATGYLLAIEDGAVAWRRELGGEARAAPAVRDGTVYTATVDGAVQATGLDGEPLWSTATADSVYTTPAVDGEQVYALVKGSVATFDLASGERNWRTDIGVSLINGLVVTEDGVYLGGNDVTALSLDGQPQWSYPIPGESGGYGAPVVIDGTVFVGACIKWDPADPYDDHMYALV